MILRLSALLLALLLMPVQGLAQIAAEEASIKDVLEVDQEIDELIEEAEAEGEILDRRTPLSALLLLRAVLDAEDFDRAEEFLDMRYLPREMESQDAATLLEQLHYVWTRQEILDIARIDDTPEGRQNDNLPEYRDLVGTIELRRETIPIYLQRIPDGAGGWIWKFSNATVARIPDMWKELGYGPSAAYLSDALPDITLIGMENWQLLYLLLAVVLGWPAATGICWLLSKALVQRDGPFQSAITRFLHIQFRIFLYIMIIRFVVTNIGLSVRTMLLMQSSGVIYIAGAILVMGLINLGVGYQIRRMVNRSQGHYQALIKPAGTVLKLIVIIIAFLMWASHSGYDISAILAGLGVGSLAVALAAQKTLENVIGAITIYTARPIRPGDFCRFGGVLGVVEEIGLRSTAIRTLNRTLVMIPNAVFSADEVENFTLRDRFRFLRQLRLEVGSRQAAEAMLAGIRELLSEHRLTIEGTTSAYLEEIADNTILIRIEAGIETQDFGEYLSVAEELNLSIIGLAETLDAEFSGPGRQVTLHETDGGAQDPRLSVDRAGKYQAGNSVSLAGDEAEAQGAEG